MNPFFYLHTLKKYKVGWSLLFYSRSTSESLTIQISVLVF